MNILKDILKSRTLAFALLIAVLSVLQGFVFLLPITPFQQMLVGLVIAVVVTVLRYLTTLPLSSK